MRTIGIQKELTNVADFLTENGYSVQMLGESIDSNTSKLNGLDAVVTAGYNTDMLGYSDTETKVPVIDASGLTAQEIKNMIDKELIK